MANVKITELFATTSPASTDVLVVVDLPADVTKKVTIADLLENAGNGSQTAPAFAFSSDSNTGIFLDAADRLGISTNGVGRIYIAADGKVGIGTSAPSEVLDVVGNAEISGTLDVTGATTFDGNLTVEGNLTVNGTTTTIDSTTLVVEDKNIELGVVTTPTDVTADGGGITLKGTTDKTINWVNSTDAWTLSEHVNIASAKEYRIDGTKVLDATSLGSAVVSSSLTSVGTIGTGVWNGTPIATAYIADSSVTSAKIVDGTIVDADVNASAAIGLSKLATGALPTGITVASANIVDGTIVNADVNASAAIGLSKLATGALPTGITVASANIVAGAVDTSELASGSVTSPKIDNNAVITAKIADNTVTTAKIVDIAVTTAKIVDNAVTADKIANGAVTNAKLQADSVGTGKIQDDAVNGDKLANDITIANNLTVTNNLTVNGTRINSSGNIGVGITSPISKLHLHKASANGFDGLRFTNTATGITATDGFVVGLNDSEEGKIWHYDNKSIQFGVDNNLYGILRQDGRWCLGEDQTSGAKPLNVYKDSGSSAQFHSDSEPGIEIKDNGDNSVVEIRHDGAQMVVDLDLTNQVTGESFVIKRDGTSANETELFRIDSSGNVGLGVATPDEKLHVRGGHIVIGQSSGSSTDLRNYIKFGREANPKAGIGFINNSANGRGDIIFMNDNASDGAAFSDSDEVMRINASGNVGIGTSSPAGLLHLKTSTSAANHLITCGSVTGTSTIYFGDPNGDFRGGISYLHTDDALTLSTNGTSSEDLRINSSGDVGIGTTSPTSKLHVKGTDNVENFLLESNQTNSRIEFASSETISTGNRVLCGAREDDFAVNLGSALNTRFLVQAGGNVGIGTTTPGVKLDVTGEIRAADGVLFGTDSADANTLDDYEEGSWVPAYAGSTGNPTVTYDQQYGRYVKIGKLVHCEGRIRTDAVSGGSGNLRISGLPFPSMNEANARGSFFPTFTVGWSTNVPTQGRVRQNVTYVDLARMTSTSVSTNMFISDLTDGGNKNDIHFVISYRAKV